MNIRKVITAICLVTAMWAGARVVTYPVPEGAPVNDSYTLEVRGGSDDAWMPVGIYGVKVDETVGGKHTVRMSSMAILDFDGTLEVKLTPKDGRVVERARVRPLSLGVETRIEGSSVFFTLDKPANASVEVNEDIFDNLQLFAGPIEEGPDAKELKKLKKDKNFVYFAPGYHKLEKPLKVKSNQRVYIPGGAFIDGVINIDSVSNVKVWGRGVVYPSYRAEGIYVRNSDNVEVDGLMTTQLPVGGSRDVNIKNVKVISSYGWGDGFNVFASDRVSYDGVFARTSDDCTTVYCTRMGFNGSARDIKMENSTLWADVAHVFEIGLHGNVEQPDSAVNLTYRNIDVLDEKEMQLDYQGVMSIDVGDNNLVKNVLFENIRIENFRQGRLLSMRLCWNKKYCGAPGRGIENVTFKDIYYNGDNSEISLILGYDETRTIKGVTFDNLVINGVKVCDDMPGKPKWYKTSDMARIYVGEHVEGVEFK